MLPIGLILLAGCGEREPPRPGTTLVATLGDSIIEGAPYDEGLIQKSAQARLGARYSFRNCGVSGERTDEIAARLDECAEDAEILIVQGGINDIAQGRPVADAARDLQDMVRRGKAKGLRVLLADVLPWPNGHPRVDGQIADLNDRIRAIARAEGVRVLPFHDTLEDPANPGTMKPEWISDGDHPSEEGYELLGRIIDVD